MQDYGKRHVSFDNVTCHKATDNAILVTSGDEDWSGELWFPISQVHDDSDVYREGDEGVLIVTRWIAEQKDLL